VPARPSAHAGLVLVSRFGTQAWVPSGHGALLKYQVLIKDRQGRNPDAMPQYSLVEASLRLEGQNEPFPWMDRASLNLSFQIPVDYLITIF